MGPRPENGSTESAAGNADGGAAAESEEVRSLNFIEQIIEADRAAGKNDGRVHTRFPPEPNGYLHIGHAKSICLNFGLATRYGGQCNLRFDDTNPTKEDVEYVNSIQADVKWLGFDWEDRLYFSSDFFEELYQFAERLIQEGLAYVDSQNLEEMRQNRGTVTQAGIDSRDRTRSVEENLDLFRRMRAGEFDDGAHVLRAKIDMAHPNMLMRDPLLYRIRHAHHHRTGDSWCIYPMYDWTHGQCDSLEGVTHSICTLEFETHRALYDWFLEQLGIYHPQQIEFARLHLSYTVMSKRKLLELVENKLVDGWDDPRMPTISGLRRRGFTSESIRAFCDRIGIARMNSVVDLAWLEQAIRDDLNAKAPRVMGVLRPLKVVIENYPEDQVDELEAANHPADESFGKRILPFSREVYVEQADFLEDAPRKYFRLSPGREVRLRYAYLVTCTGVVKDDDGNVIEVRCTYDPESKGGNAPDGRKVKGTIHWVSAKHAIDAEVRLYDRLFNQESPDNVPEGQDWKDNLNSDSLEILTSAKVEPSLGGAEPGTRIQFERNGYFCVDQDSTSEKVVFNRTATLRDSWAKRQNK
jgi:glutaminyl-tRNA synthetase